jgi:predicted transcriptional regulator
MIERDTTTLKRQVIEALERMPDDSTLDDIIDCAIVVSTIGEGLAQAERGEVVPHEEVVKRMSRLLR